MNKKPNFNQDLEAFNTEQLRAELLKRQIHEDRCVAIDTNRDGSLIFSIDNDGNLLLEIGIKKHRIHLNDIKRLLILFGLLE